MFKRNAIDLDRDNSIQYFIGFLCLVVYAGSLFFPLMDKDAAHHANIALHMLEHHDYVSLVDRQSDYLDKPHFLFWSSAISFKIFGVNSFAHRLPALLFALVSIYSTYRLTLHLTDKGTARLAALMLATAQGFIFSINDARMETPLAAAIIFGLWNLITYIDEQKIISLVLASLGAAIAFSTKGWIGVVIIFLAAFFYILLNKKWKILSRPITFLFIPLFALFIAPVLYSYYHQFDLHPEKVIRNMTNISGIKFILWDQNFERFGGDNFIKGGRNSSYAFLYHTFIWAFFPWSIAAYAALVYWLRKMFYLKQWSQPVNFAVLGFALVLFTISFSKFKMPHYIFMLLPLSAIFTAPFLNTVLESIKWRRIFLPLQVFFACLIFIAIIIINYFFFPPKSIFLHILIPVSLLLLLAVIIKKFSSPAAKIIYVTGLSILVLNFTLNYNFFPSLMKYQGGNELANTIKEKGIVVDDRAIVLLDNNAHSFDFARAYNHDIMDANMMNDSNSRNKLFIMTSGIAAHLRSEGFTLQVVASHPDYNVAKMKLKFLNPKTREKQLDTLMLAKVYR